MFFLPFGSVRRFKGEVAAIRRHNNGVPARREPAPHSGVWFAQRPFKGERVESRSRFVKGAFPVRAPEKPKQRLIYRQARYGSGFKGCLHKVVTISKARGSESCLFLEVFSRPGSQGPGNFICSTVVTFGWGHAPQGRWVQSLFWQESMCPPCPGGSGSPDEPHFPQIILDILLLPTVYTWKSPDGQH